MGARVSFLAEASDDKTQSGAAPSGVSLPDTAVQSEGAGSATGVVFVLHDDVVERRAVKLGAKIGSEQITVLSGVNAGERVALGDFAKKIGRAACRESVCRYVSISVVAV